MSMRIRYLFFFPFLNGIMEGWLICVQKPWDEQIFEIVTRAQERGVWSDIYVGGCCRAGPEEIAKLRKRIDSQ